jgi:ATP-dependent Clp protease ATP-binding subunit ClpC
MWQKFTERARRVVFFSQEEAQAFGEGYVSTEHLLLGLLREDNTAREVLSALGCNFEGMAVDLRQQLPTGSSMPSHDMTLTPRAKRVIDLAYDESRNLNNGFIGTEHLLLGLVREEDGLGGRVLSNYGVFLPQARVAVHELHKARGIDSTAPPSMAPARVKTRNVTDRDLLHIRQQRHPLDRFALLLLAEPGPATACIEALGIHVNALQTSLEQHINALPGGVNSKTPPSITDVIAHAVELSAGAPLTSAHLLVAIARNESSLLHHLLKEEGVDVDKLG